MENILYIYNINGMNRGQLYRQAQNLATELGYDLTPLRQQWRGSTSNYWRNEIQAYQRNIRNRDRRYNVALRISRENREPLQRLAITRGTDYAYWNREVRRLQMRARRNPIGIQRVQEIRNRVAPILAQVQQRDNLQRRRVQRRNRLIQAQLQRQVRRRVVDGFIRSGRFQQVFNRVIANQDNVLTNQQATNMYNAMRARGRYRLRLVINGQEQYIPVNETTRDFIIDLLMNGIIEVEGANWGSDVLDNINYQDIESITISQLPPPQRIIANRDGRFFPHINNTDLDLSKYQIYNQDQAYDIKKREHCLIHSLLQCGVDKALVNEVKMTFKSGCNFKKSDLKKVSEIIKKCIVLHSIKPDGKIRKTKFKGGNDDIDIAIHENHYFIFEDTIYSKFFINNYDKCKDMDNKFNIVKLDKGKYPHYSNDRKINSLLMVVKLLSQQLFKKLDMIKFEETASHQELREHIYLSNIENEQEECKEKEEKKTVGDMGVNRYTEEKKVIKAVKKLTKEKPKQEIFYADCESFVNGDNHELYLLGCANDRNDNVSIYNVCNPIHQNQNVEAPQHLIYEWLNAITKYGKQDALVYYHNLKYDYHLLEPYINIKNKCEKDGSLYNVIISHKKCEIELRDSYKILPFALSKFTKEFDLDKQYAKKEAINYTYYTKENNNQIIKVDDYLNGLSKKEKEIFKTNVKEEYTYDKYQKTFNPTSYYMDYLKLDCLVLKKGIQKFNTLIQEITENKMSVYECLTISSLTDKYMIKEGAYDGVYQVKGNLRAYIAKAVYGGRVCVNKKYKKKIIEGKISDYDGVSLYPSAINRLCRIMGLPTGKATRYTTGKQTIKKLVEVDEEIFNCWGFGYDEYVGIVNNEYYYFYDDFNKYTQGEKLNEFELKRLNRFLEDSKKSSIKECSKVLVSKMVLDYPETDLNTWKDKTYSVLTVKINKVNKIQQMPFIAHKNEDGLLEYTNKAPKETLIIDSITLQDYIKFHDIEYEILDGVYWNEGSNKKMGEVIQRLFKARLQAKKDNKTALSNTIKLMLNSSYGKTIMKKSKTEYAIVKTQTHTYDKKNKKWIINKKKNQFENYIYNNFNTIKRWRKMNDNSYEVEKICSDNSFNRGHIGCAILSMSKRIMNEVFDVANTEKAPIYYTDTDSLHCNLWDVNRINLAYWFKYKKELTGKNLEQFHTDFDLDGAKDEIYATKSIFLGKKSYLDVLESKDEKGKTINGYHIRLKGITEAGLKEASKKYINSYEGLYTDLAKGEEIEITLNPYDEEEEKQKVMFEYVDGKVRTRKTFTRKVKF